MAPYIYRSEGPGGTRQFVAMCPIHARVLAQGDRQRCQLIADAHRKCFHA